MRRSRPFKASIALAFILTAFIATADTTQLDREIASLYVDVVGDSSIDIDHALALVNSALDFDSNSSDALFLRAYLGRSSQAGTISALSDLRRALENNNFTAVATQMAATTYAEGLLRIRKPEEALLVLQAADLSAPDVEMRLIADALYTQARAFRMLDLGREATLATAQGRSQFPNDARFFLLELESESVPSFVYRREVDRLLRVGVDGPPMQRVLLQYALTAPVASERLWGRATYLELGGSDPRISLALAGIDNLQLVDAFIQLNGYARRDVYLALLDILRVGEGAGSNLEILLEGQARFTGVSTNDAEGDGYWEERVTVSEGLVERWEIDMDQNGVNEVDLLFRDGEPARLAVEQEQGVVLVLFDSYPYVGSVTIPGGDYRTRFNVSPHGIRLPIVQTLPVGGHRLDSALELPVEFAGVDLSAVALAATDREEIGPAGNVVEIRSLEGGVATRIRRDTNGDGAMDHLLVLRDGVPLSGLRDIDGDGYFEVAEGYSGGFIEMVSVDEDDNGTPDVTEYSREGGERAWDLDQNGTVDVREFGVWTDSVLMYFPFMENRR